MKNLFILYPGGCGGNHVANIISTNPKFTPRFKSDNYLEDLYADYKSKVDEIYYGPKTNHLDSVKGLLFHFAEYNNLDQLKDEEQVKILLENDTINIFNGHEHCYAEIDIDYKNLSRMPDAFWIMLSYPKENTVPYNRINLYKFTPNKERYAFPFYPSWNSIEVNHNNGLILESELIFTEYGSQYIRESLKPLDIDLPPIADTLHSMWYNKIKEVLVLYDAFPK